MVEIRNTFEPGEYKYKSYGNYVVIESILDTETIRLKYNHLRSVGVEVGDIISKGEVFGTSGETGNAQTNDGVPVIPHVHIRARKLRNGDWIKTDPEEYLFTKFDNQSNPITNDCN